MADRICCRRLDRLPTTACSNMVSPVRFKFADARYGSADGRPGRTLCRLRLAAEFIPGLVASRRFQQGLRQPAHLHDQHPLRTGDGPQDLSLYFDFTHSKGVHLTRFINLNRTGILLATPGFGDVFVTRRRRGKSLYQRLHGGHEKALQQAYQFEWNYVLSKDKDDDSNERDPFTDRSFTPSQSQLWTMRCLIAISGTSSTSLPLPKCPGDLKATSGSRRARRSQSRRRRARQQTAIRCGKTTSTSRLIGESSVRSSLASASR